MLDVELLSSIANQMMAGTEVSVQGKRLPVRRTSSQRLFVHDGGSQVQCDRAEPGEAQPLGATRACGAPGGGNSKQSMRIALSR